MEDFVKYLKLIEPWRRRNQNMELYDGETQFQDDAKKESEKLKKELISKAVKDQNTLRLSSVNIDKDKTDKELASAIYQLAEISFTIINYIRKNQEKIFTARKFIEHYQDKAVLLCRKFASMNEASSVVVDDAFINTKSNIRNVLINFVPVFNNEYKRITDTDHIDINAELAVLVEDMQQQGIEVEKLKENDVTKENAKKEKIQKTYDDIEERIDEIDLGNILPEDDEPKKKNHEHLNYDVYTNPNHPMYNRPKNAEVERVLIAHCAQLVDVLNEMHPSTDSIKKCQKEYAIFWFNNIATQEQVDLIHKYRRDYLLRALSPLVIFSLHKQYVKSPTFILRFIMFWTLIPAVFGLIEGFKTLIGDDEDFLAEEAMDIFFDTPYWIKLTTWYDIYVKGNRIHKISHRNVVYE